MSTIGARVKELRQAKGMTQLALAGDGLSAGYVSLIESGQRSPSAKMAERLAERLGVTADILLATPDPSVSDEARLTVNFASLSLANGEPSEAVRCLDQLSLSGLDDQTAIDAALVLAEGLQQTGDLDQAARRLEESADRCRRAESWLHLARATTALTIMYIESGDMDQAVERAGDALKDVEAAGLQGTDEHIRLGATYVWACYERGDVLFASLRVEELIGMADRHGTTRARGSIYWNAALIAHGRGQVKDAIRLTERALALIGEQEESRDLPRLRMQYALILLHTDEPRAAEALEQLDRAEADIAFQGAQLDLGTLATLRGRAHLVLGEVDDAAEQAARALSLLGPSDHLNRASALILLGDVGTAQYDEDLAREAYGEAELVIGRIPESRALARMWRELGDGWRDLGDHRRALQSYDKTLGLVGLPPRPASSRLRLRATRGAYSVAH